MNIYICSFVFREEVVDGRHDLRRARSQELAEAMLSVLLSLFFVVKHSHATTRLVNSANSTPMYIYLLIRKKEKNNTA
jgi:hypothetical protein